MKREFGQLSQNATSAPPGPQQTHFSTPQASTQNNIHVATKVITTKVMVSIAAALVVVTGGIGTFAFLHHASQSVQVAQPIQRIIDNYYQLVEQERYEDIYYTYISASTRVNGQDYSGRMDTPPIRAMVEGFWSNVDQTKGKVSSYTITRASQDNAGYTHVMINETRNGKSYEVELVFIDIGSQWILFDIRGI